MSKTGCVLYVTVGTRDIQLQSSIDDIESIKSDETDHLIIKNPRQLAEAALFANPAAWSTAFRMPIIEPAIRYILKKNAISSIVLVLTDQTHVSDNFRKNDTIHFGTIIEYLIKEKFSSKIAASCIIYKIVLQENIIFLDSMFNYFTNYFDENNLTINNINQPVYFYGQGGLDSINTALLLNLIERYPNLIQLQKPAGRGDMVTLQFIEKFRIGFQKRIFHEKIETAVRNYNYQIASAIESSDSIGKILSEYALARLQLDFKRSKRLLRDLINLDPSNRDIFFKWDSTLPALNDSGDSIRELFVSALIKYKQRAYSDCLWRLFTLSENILKPYIESRLDGVVVYNKVDNHEKWKKLIGKFPDLLAHLDTVFVSADVRLNYNEPSRRVFFEIFIFFKRLDGNEQDELLIRIIESLEKISKIRNDIAHKIKSVSVDDINDRLNGLQTLDSILKDISLYFFKIENPLAHYDEINDFIINSDKSN